MINLLRHWLSYEHSAWVTGDISCTALYLNSDNMTLMFLILSILKMLYKC